MNSQIIKEKYGKWKSSLTAEEIAKKTIGFSDLQVVGEHIFWTESRPWEKGKSFLVSQNRNGIIEDETTEDFHVSTSVHGYGGGSFFVNDDFIYFFDSLTKKVYQKNRKTKTFIPVSQEEGYAYADFSVDKHNKILVALRLNSKSNTKFPVTEIVGVDLVKKQEKVLFSGSDFYSNVRLNHEGNKILFLQWNYPNMPWDENELWTADIETNLSVLNIKKIYHKCKVAVYQPQWYENRIIASVNENDFWQISYIEDQQALSIFQHDIEFGRPLWLAASKTYDFIHKKKLVVTGCEKGVWKTYLFDTQKHTLEKIDNSLTCIQTMSASENFVAYLGGNAESGLNIYISKREELNKVTAIRSDAKGEHSISKPKLLEFSSPTGLVYAFYYPPANKNYLPLEAECPPCIIKVHGGPTHSADYIYNSKIQFYTDRGFAYVEINYGGSSGYGKEFRQRLDKQWGVVDTQDCLACATFLIENKLAHAEKLFLAGSSSGGFTVLNTLAMTDIFKAASCHYGVTNLVEMAKHVHKFEACYDQNLIGDTIENNINLYKERSPSEKASQIKTPIILFHGDKDPVVHLSQSEDIVEVLRKNNVPHSFYILPGEGHGFKKEESVVFVLNKELEFFQSFL